MTMKHRGLASPILRLTYPNAFVIFRQLRLHSLLGFSRWPSEMVLRDGHQQPSAREILDLHQIGHHVQFDAFQELISCAEGLGYTSQLHRILVDCWLCLLVHQSLFHGAPGNMFRPIQDAVQHDIQQDLLTSSYHFLFTCVSFEACSAVGTTMDPQAEATLLLFIFAKAWGIHGLVSWCLISRGDNFTRMKPAQIYISVASTSMQR